MSHLLVHAANLQQAFETLRRFGHLVTDEFSVELVEAGNTVELRSLGAPDQPLALRRLTAETLMLGLLRLIRHFGGPSAKVTRVWGPAPVTCSGAEVDLRVGGRYRIDNLLPDGTVLRIVGEFEVVDPPNRLVYSWQIERAESAPGEASRVTVRFEPRNGATEVIIVHERIDTEPTRVNHEQGWFGCLDGLEKLFEASGEAMLTYHAGAFDGSAA